MFSVGTHTECIHTYICISIYIAVYTDWHRQKTSITRRPSEAQMAQSCSSSSAGQGCSTLTKHMHVSMYTQYRSLQWMVLGAHSITRLRPWVSLALGPICDHQGAPQPCGQWPPTGHSLSQDLILRVCLDHGLLSLLGHWAVAGAGFPLLWLLCSFALAAVSPRCDSADPLLRCQRW